MLKSCTPQQSRPIAGNLGDLRDQLVDTPYEHRQPVQNPLQAFLEPTKRDEYSRLMGGIGRVAVAVSYAEFTVDMLGWSLTGELEAYLTLTKRMSLGPKVDCVKDMSKSLITDNGLQDGVKTFYDNLKKIINKRNYAVHSLYGVDRGDAGADARAQGHPLGAITEALRLVRH